MRILVAEDELIIRTLVGDVLRKSDFDVVKVSNGAEAWEAMQTSDAPPLAILDWMMPELDGLEVVRRIRARTTNRPPYLILLTARDSKVDLVAGLQAGANDYVSKPFDPRELLARAAVGRRMVELVGVHRPELENLEWLVVQPRSFLPEKHRSGAGKLDDGRNCNEKRRQEKQAESCPHDVDQPLRGEMGRAPVDLSCRFTIVDGGSAVGRQRNRLSGRQGRGGRHAHGAGGQEASGRIAIGRRQIAQSGRTFGATLGKIMGKVR